MITGLGLMILSVPCSIWDLKKREIPLLYVGIFSAAGLIFTIFTQRIPLIQVLLGMAIGAMFLLISVLSRNHFGFGDGLILCAIGCWAGGAELFSIACMAFLLTVLTEGLLLVLKKRTMKSEIPFVPFLAAACLIEWVAGL